VLDVDRFGNVVVNVREADLEGATVARVEVAGRRILGLSAFYDPAQPLVALFNSEGWLEIAVPGGSSAQSLDVVVGAPIAVQLQPEHPL
jgi:S-adenosylmethionine hydrolase